MSIIYLDYNCFQRSFDDFRQTRIQMESLACQEIFTQVEQDKIRLVWSFMHEDETILCPFPERKYEIIRLSDICRIHIGPKEEILQSALSIQKKAKLSSKDALHLACAYYAESNFFITCDDKLIDKANKLELNFEILNPITYIRQENK